MGRLTSILNITADKFVADKNGGLQWHLPFWDEELCACLIGELEQADKLLLGRNTYEGLKAHNSATLNNLYAAKSDLMLAETLNGMQKIVISKRQVKELWYNTEQLCNDLQLQQVLVTGDADVVVLGSIELVKCLTEKQLIGGFVLWQHPLDLGSGISIADAERLSNDFELTDSYKLSSGVTRQNYRRREPG